MVIPVESVAIGATDCSAYRFLIPMPPWSAGPYTTALAVVPLYPIFGRNVIIALFSILTHSSSSRYVATNGYVTAGI
jgi:hypothetical protein